MRIFNEEVIRMAGHSKWNNIKQRKGAQDAKRGKIFQKLSKEIYQAAKDGGPDTEDNAALRSAVEDARAQNMPKDNIDRAIAKATNAGAGEDYHAVLYEGYGPGGVAVLVDGLTDNANRTSANVRAAFTKNESMHIPVILSESGVQDMVYNDFYIGEGAEVTIVARFWIIAGICVAAGMAIFYGEWVVNL